MKHERLPSIPASEALNKVQQATGKTPKRLYEFSLGDLYKTVAGKNAPIVEAKLGEVSFSDVLYQGETFANKAKSLVEGKIGTVNNQLVALREGLETDEQKREFDQLVKSYERSRRGLLGAAVRHKVFEKVDFSIKDDVLTVVSNQDQKPYAQYLSGMRLGEKARANLERQRKRELVDKQEINQDEAMLVAHLPGEDIFISPIIASHEEINGPQELSQQETEGGSVDIFTSNRDFVELHAEGIGDLPGEDIFTSISVPAVDISSVSFAREGEVANNVAIVLPEQIEFPEQDKQLAEIAALPGVEIFV